MIDWRVVWFSRTMGRDLQGAIARPEMMSTPMTIMALMVIVSRRRASTNGPGLPGASLSSFISA